MKYVAYGCWTISSICIALSVIMVHDGEKGVMGMALNALTFAINGVTFLLNARYEDRRKRGER
jgi:hypothetical protein